MWYCNCTVCCAGGRTADALVSGVVCERYPSEMPLFPASPPLSPLTCVHKPIFPSNALLRLMVLPARGDRQGRLVVPS
jgi:hypothetical protein